MNCEFVKENVVLYLYDELPDDARHELEHHAAGCNVCAAEMRDARKFRDELKQRPMLEPTPNLLAASRMRLSEALEGAEQSPWWRRAFDPVDWLRQMKFSPALASAILIIGFFGGVMTTFVTGLRNKAEDGKIEIHTNTSDASIAGIQSITPKSEDKVEIKYDRTVTESKEGNLSDPAIQKLLLYAARNQYNSGVRIDSVKLLSENPQNDAVRDVLTTALRNDKNPGVRLKALQGLEAFVAQDTRVRDAVLEALVNDTNNGVRTEAIHALSPVKADTSVRVLLQQLAAHDKNAYIRLESERMLASLPALD